MVNTIRIKVA